MPNDNPEATPEELVTPTGVQVPGQAAEEASPQTEPQTDKPLTLEAVRELIKEEASRIAQSQVAKGENRIQKLIQERFQALEKTKGPLGLSDEQVAQARQKIVTDAYSAPEDEPQTQPDEQPAEPSVEQAIQFMNRQVNKVFAKVGQTVTKSDPEYAAFQKAIDDNWTNEDGLSEIILAAQAAASAKAQRLQSQQSTAVGRVTAGGHSSSGQAQQQPASSHEAWEQAYRKT